MMLPLEPTDDLANPAFKDAAACTHWLSQLQLTNLNLAQGTLRKQLDELNRCPLRGNDRLQILETLRETVSLVQTDIAKKLFGKKLPFLDEEFTLLIGVSSLWHSMLNGYLRCLQMAEAGDKQLAKQTSLLCQRSLLYCSLQLEEFSHAGCEPDPGSWQQLHAIYAYVETLNLQTEAVHDKHYLSAMAISCRTLYAKTLLMHRARLTGLTRSQWHIAERWLGMWGDALSIEPRCSMSKDDAPPLAVDLGGTLALQSIRHARDADSMRYLAMVPLSKLIRVKTILLQQGQTPQQVELGSGLSSKDCIDLLNKLHTCWCETRADSLADSPREGASLYLCIGLEKIYAQIARKPFKPIKDSSKADKVAQRQIETFGRVLDETGQHELRELGFVPEEWLIEEDGLLRGRMLRMHTGGERLGPNQIISVFPPNTANHKVGVIDFVRVTQHGHLYIGVHYLPGQPQALVVRGNVDNESLQSGSAAALMLPALEKLRIPASLILPREWFRAGRELELNLPDHSKQSISLGFSVEKGSDYERVSFTQGVQEPLRGKPV